MLIARAALVTFLLGLVALCATGCVVQRTVKEGDAVVAQGYAIKVPRVVP
jgi:hypothetical protein